jgi:hypothetical protein
MLTSAESAASYLKGIATTLFRTTVAGIACLLCRFGTLAYAQETFKTCAGLEVRSIRVSVERDGDVLRDAMPAKIEITPDIFPIVPNSAGKAVTVTALGPILGSMDSPKASSIVNGV